MSVATFLYRSNKNTISECVQSCRSKKDDVSIRSYLVSICRRSSFLKTNSFKKRAVLIFPIIQVRPCFRFWNVPCRGNGVWDAAVGGSFGWLVSWELLPTTEDASLGGKHGSSTMGDGAEITNMKSPHTVSRKETESNINCNTIFFSMLFYRICKIYFCTIKPSTIGLTESSASPKAFQRKGVKMKNKVNAKQEGCLGADWLATTQIDVISLSCLRFPCQNEGRNITVFPSLIFCERVGWWNCGTAPQFPARFDSLVFVSSSAAAHPR